MHEVGIAQEAVETAIECAARAGGTRVLLIKLRIGALSGVVPDALEFAFDLVTKETAAEGAKLEWEWVPVKCRCEPCGKEFEPTDVVYECPDCGVASWDVLAGKELDLVSVEAE